LGLIDELLPTSLLALDTATFIYFIEEHPEFAPRVNPLFQRLTNGDCRAIASTVTLVEVLTAPIRQGNFDLAKRYGDILMNARNLTLVPVSSAIAQRAARLRAAHGLRTPDAIIVASALESKCDHLITNDLHLKRVSELSVIMMNEL